MAEGPKAVTFAHILRYDTFPLADILKQMLQIATDEMKCSVEIEFAADLDNRVFHMLQIRPISSDGLRSEVDWDKVSCEHALVRSSSSLGTGWIADVKDIVYVKRNSFDKMRTAEIAAEITALNTRFRNQGVSYLLIGYGRWGTHIPSLGIPVDWSDISEAKALVECSLEDFRVDPSQGSHFFQNLTSFNVGYVSVDEFSRKDDFIDHQALMALPALSESEFVRHIRLEQPLQLCVDGRTGKALIGI